MDIVARETLGIVEVQRRSLGCQPHLDASTADKKVDFHFPRRKIGVLHLLSLLPILAMPAMGKNVSPSTVLLPASSSHSPPKPVSDNPTPGQTQFGA